jgi:hypothetical protein
MRDSVDLVSATGQAWKLRLSNGVLFVAGVAAAVQLLGPREWTLAAVGIVMAAGTVGLLLVARIRCRSCRKSLGYWAMRTQGVMEWQNALATLQACPHCGRPAAEEASGTLP